MNLWETMMVMHIRGRLGVSAKLLVLGIMLCSSRASYGQKLGATKVLTADYGVTANWNQSNNSEAVIQIPAGWVIVKQDPGEASRTSGAHRNVKLIEAQGHVLTRTEVESKLKELRESMAKFQEYELETKLKMEGEHYLRAASEVKSSHKAVIIQCTARGNGNPVDRKRSWIRGTYSVTVKYVGTSKDFGDLLAKYRRLLPNNPMPPAAKGTAISIHNRSRNTYTVTIVNAENGMWKTRSFAVAPGRQLNTGIVTATSNVFWRYEGNGLSWTGRVGAPNRKQLFGMWFEEVNVGKGREYTFVAN